MIQKLRTEEWRDNMVRHKTDGTKRINGLRIKQRWRMQMPHKLQKPETGRTLGLIKTETDGKLKGNNLGGMNTKRFSEIGKK